MQYAGSGSFLERDAEGHRMVVEAKGRDKRGNGTAGAHVTAGFVEVDAGSTRVEVVTDLQVTGKPAQFGRGVMQDVSDKLLGQFVDCLEARIGTPAGADPAVEPAVEPPVEPIGGPAPAAPQPTDAIDLGRTVLPAVGRAYGVRIGLALVALLLLVRRLVRRR